MRLSIAVLALAVSLVLTSSARLSAHDHEHMREMAAAKPLSGASLYNLKSRWTNQDGKSEVLASLRGAPVVVAMAYTSCKDICPLIVANMVGIENQAKGKGLSKVRFAFFSLDSLVDTPARLKAYADERGLDMTRWTLFHGDDKSVRELAAALGVRYRPDGQGGFNHSAAISLLDADGNIAFQLTGVKDDVGDLMKSLEVVSATAK